MADETWTWKSKNGATGGLLYEPGNWGDLLKGAWVVAVARRMAQAYGERFVYVDPFAGAPDYPLGSRAATRFARLAPSPFVGRAGGFVKRGVWPNAATLVRTACGLPPDRTRVFDADPERRARLTADAGVSLLDAADGWDAAARFAPDPRGLLLIDPYDLVGDGRAKWEIALAAAKKTNVLLYVYNRAAKGPECLKEYRAFRNVVEDARTGAPVVAGRIPADGFLPSAHHEMIFLPHGETAALAGYAALRDELASAALILADAVRASGIVEG